MTKENVDIKFDKVVAETISETHNLVIFDFVVDISTEFITDAYDTIGEFFNNFRLVFINSFSDKNMIGTKKKEVKMNSFKLFSDDSGNFYRCFVKYSYEVPRSTDYVYKIGYQYKVIFDQNVFNLPEDVTGPLSRVVPVFEAGKFTSLVQDLTNLQTFDKLERFVETPKLSELIQIDKILYKKAKSDNWHSDFFSARAEEGGYLFYTIVDAEKFMSENYRLNSLISDKLSATENILEVHATTVEKGSVSSVRKTRIGKNKLLVSIKASYPKIKVNFVFKDNSKDRAKKIVDAIALGPEVALELDDFIKFVDANKVFELLKEPKYYQKIKESFEAFSYQIFLMFPELTSQSQSQTLYTSDPGFRSVEKFVEHKVQTNPIRLSLGNSERFSLGEHKFLVSNNTKSIFGEQKDFYLRKGDVKGNVNDSEVSYLNFPSVLKDSVKANKEYTNPIELFYDILTGKELTIANSVNLLAAEVGLGVFKEFEPDPGAKIGSMPVDIFDVFLGTPKVKEDNSALLDELPLDGLENYFSELVNIAMTGDKDWLHPPTKYPPLPSPFKIGPAQTNADSLGLPNSIKYLITRNVIVPENSFERLDTVFFEPNSNNLRKYLYPIFFFKYLFLFRIEYYNPTLEKWESLTNSILTSKFDNLFCRLVRYENKKYIPEELFKKFRRNIEINNGYFVLTSESERSNDV